MTLKKALLPFLILASAASAQDLVTTGQPADQTLDNLTPSLSIDLANFLEITEIAGQTVVIETDLGHIPIELLASDAPRTVENFLSYVNDQSYDNSIIHRSIPGFVIQGGGFTAGLPVVEIPSKAPVINEFKVSNTRGTIAMAKLGGDPNSATNEWFINLDDNSQNLDEQNGGFTVFARVIGNGMAIADQIASLPRYNFGGAFTDTPLESLLGAEEPLEVEDLVALPKLYLADPLPIESFAGFTAVSSTNADITNPGLADIDGSLLTLTLAQGLVGSSDISITAQGAAGNTVQLSFTLTLEEAFATLDKSTTVTPYQANNYQLEVTSNTVWTTTGVPDWISLSETTGDGSATLTVTLAENTQAAPRIGQFTLFGQSHTVYQRANFDAWLANTFSPEQIGSMSPDKYQADSDGDGLSNIVEHVLQLDPSDRNAQLAQTFLSLGDNLRVTYAPLPETVTIDFQTSSNLQTWTSQTPIPLSATNDSNSQTIEIEVEKSQYPFFRIQYESPLFTPPQN